jgi:predicted CopG family antitoxin
MVDEATDATKTIAVTPATHRALWQQKDVPGDTFDEIIRELLVEARDVEVSDGE